MHCWGQKAMVELIKKNYCRLFSMLKIVIINRIHFKEAFWGVSRWTYNWRLGGGGYARQI